ncbi:GH36-type glycosyl hydrolase domain-containing protein [Sediminibacillus sp. JSM 1682029]|uniref:GH36-type glycosyl hydrolase domain-containing protein n=1 Tax=Sediminibacillus sp. JSM 1682029 TaxID=3229857 RepID=UPI0035257E9B
MPNTPHHFQAGEVSFSFMESGDIFQVTHNQTLINQWLANPIDGALNNVYLRVHQPDGTVVSVPMIGVQSNSKIEVGEKEIVWSGTFQDIDYQVRFLPGENNCWFWDITLDGKGKKADIIYGQDLGLADKGAVRANEAYMSQYMDHKVFNDEQKGYVVCTRQNQPQSDGFPYLQQGCLQGASGFSTDGFQFFGLSYKTTNQPEALTKPELQNDIYQYEFAYTALQSKQVTLHGSHRFVFYGLFKPDHPEAVTALDYQEEIEQAWKATEKQKGLERKAVDRVVRSTSLGEPLQTLEMTEQEIDRYFPDRQLEEKDQNGLLSFFTDTYEHIVLKRKETMVERPHGHILMSGGNHVVRDDNLSTTSYMYGIFNSQLAIGNVNMNKMMTNARNPLNIAKTPGQRVYIELEGSYRLLTMPSLFEIGFNYARWYYKLENDTIIITNFTTVDSKQVQLEAASQSGRAYRYLVTNQMTMQNNEYEVPFHYEVDNQTVTFTADKSADSSSVYPALNYQLHVAGPEAEFGDEQKLADSIKTGDASLVVLTLAPASEWTIVITGGLRKEKYSAEKRSSAHEIKRYREYFHGLLNDFHLRTDSGSNEALEKVNALAWWYTHNMLVHFSTPHGLEQYGGAAWGTRDVCQGPTEYFMATQNEQTVKEIIKMVYSHQYQESGNWPQWFMFDQYNTVQQADSHGDIIVWPLKVISDYVEATNDYAILQTKVPYTDRHNFAFTEETATILEHVKKQIAYIQEHFLHDTHLSAYDDGDWDDTLQPANQQLKQYMVSSWTVALTYQALQRMTSVLKKAGDPQVEEMETLLAGVKQDFQTYVLQSDVIPGFLYLEDPDKPQMMLHPSDTETGIDYRLLPMQRGIISELLTPEQAERHYQLIKQQLSFPDGVRLMNRPANYSGGVSTHFKRAEQAANFGREIGLQYVHAHIRFVEAMAKLGKAEEAWNGLDIINPIQIQKAVPNAELRQSNAYFSSSDGKFKTRYDAQDNFGKLRNGEVAVKGGWRIYSSGPGIYMNQLITNVLGIRQQSGDLVIDPVLPDSMDNLEFAFRFLNKPVTFVFHIGQKERQVLVNGEKMAVEEAYNPYRQGGLIVKKAALERTLQTDKNSIEIYI